MRCVHAKSGFLPKASRAARAGASALFLTMGACGGAETVTSQVDEPDADEEREDASAANDERDADAPVAEPDAGPAGDVDAGAQAGGDGGDFSSCAVLDLEATARKVPVDIVWIIDSSGSMRNERDAIQRELNSFAARFSDAAIDVRVVVMTEGDDFAVPAPLGLDPQRFLLVDRNVGSDDALGFFIEHFDEYASFLRPEAKLELIAVTDDESDLSASEFVTSMRGAAGKDFRLHAVASERVGDDACEGANEPGDEYYAAAGLTSGLTLSVCQADGAALFETLAGALTEGTQLPCALALPSPPGGAQLDPDLINVVYDAQSGVRAPVPRVGDPAGCGDTGWFYDNPATPSAISLCPTFCQGAGAGSLHVVFGCQTVSLL